MRMRVLAITPIFPNRLEPNFGPFNRQQLRCLAARGVEVEVLCSIPWLPGASVVGVPKRAAELSALGDLDVFDGIETRYLRRLYVPKVGLSVGVPLYLASMAPHRARLSRADVLLGTWAYPDGCATVVAARLLGKPCVVKVHGSDINVLAKRPSARAVMRRILPLADALVTVSRPMGEALAELGVRPDRIHLVPNGIDASVFGRQTKEEARRALGIDGPMILYVGRMEPQKGFSELIEAFETVHRKRPDALLVLVGDGIWQSRAEDAARRFDGKIVYAGPRPLRAVAMYMAAADLVTLPSWAEGTPNVLLEALASGRPCVATRVGGIPDVLADPRSGIVVEPRSAASLAAGLLDALARTWDAGAVRACGAVSWDESAAQLEAVLRGVFGQATVAGR